MGSSAINRFEWLKAVMQSDQLTPSAKLVASAMAVQFANGDTGQLNPSMQTLADYVKASTDTVKRAVRSLVEAGWLGRTEGRGRGNKTAYRLASPGKIITLSPEKRGSNQPSEKGGMGAPSPKEKGALVHGKGGAGAPSYIEQSSEQNDGRDEQWRNHRFEGVNFSGPTYVSKDDYGVLNSWGDWLRRQGLPGLCQMNIQRSTDGKRGKPQTVYLLPRRLPPETDRQAQDARAYFASMIEREAASYAAQ
ncbi:MAG: helix-turn-helix domain-containing protein [Pseudomonadota bacterium]